MCGLLCMLNASCTTRPCVPNPAPSWFAAAIPAGEQPWHVELIIHGLTGPIGHGTAQRLAYHKRHALHMVDQVGNAYCLAAAEIDHFSRCVRSQPGPAQRLDQVVDEDEVAGLLASGHGKALTPQQGADQSR